MTKCRPISRSHRPSSLHAGGIVWHQNSTADTSHGFRVFDSRIQRVQTERRTPRLRCR